MGGAGMKEAQPALSPFTDPTRSPVWKVLALTWPALIYQFLHLCVTLWDRFISGRFLADNGVSQLAIQSAQTTSQYFSWLISSYSVLVSVGSTALLARFFGAGDFRMARSVVNHSMWIGASLGLIASVAGLAMTPWLLPWLGLEGEAGTAASDFLFYIFLFLPFQMVESAGIACFTGAGDTKTGLYVLGGVALINIPLALFLATGFGPIPAMGFPGIALGTALSHALGGIAVGLFLIRGKSGLLWEWKNLPDMALARRILRISFPAGMDSLSIGFGQFIFLGIINRLGAAASGAHGIALGWEALGYLSGGAFGTAAISLVGLNLGAGQPKEAARCGWTAYFLGAGFMSLMGALFFFLAEPMFLLFCPDPSQAPIIKEGAPVLRLIAFAMPFLASCIIMASALRGAGDTRVPVMYTWIGFFLLRVPAALILARPVENALGLNSNFAYGLLGAWMAMFLDLFARGLMLLWRFYRGAWAHIRV